MDEGVGHEVMHEIEARGAGDHDVLGVDAQDLGREATRGGQALGRAVVVDDGVAVHEGRGGADEVEHGTRERGLLRRGLPAGHVQLESPRGRLVRLRLQACELGVQLCVR